MKPLLSIVIPTKDRYGTLIPVLQALVKDFADSDVEFIIQDNTNVNIEILLFVSELNCDRIKYFHIPIQISVTENCDEAVKNSQGRYLIMIGDDDYVLPQIINAVNWMEENGIECLNSNTATYFWPDLSFKYQTGVSKSATLLVTTPVKKTYKKIDALAELQKVIKSGGTDFANLPRLYHGIVKRTVLESIYNQCQTFFPGPSPDMANSSALAIFTKEYAIYNFPFSISGKSTSSTSGMGVNHTHVGNLDDKPFLDKKLLKQWDVKIPYFWSGDTIYAQSLSHSLRLCNFKAKINYTRLYAHLFVFERKSILKHKDVILNSVKNPARLLKIIYWYLAYTKSRAFNFLIRKFRPQNDYLIYNKIDKIEDCAKLINQIKC